MQCLSLMHAAMDANGVNGFLHTPVRAGGRSMVLTHGAGSNADGKLLVAVAQAFADAGWYVLRYNLPFRQKRKSGPPHPSGAAEDRAGLAAAAEALQERTKQPVSLAGHSYGGRQASILASEKPDVAEALLLLSYPLHPPGKPEQLRTAHFKELRTPALFVSGDSDPFGTPEELTAATVAIEAMHELVFLEKSGHDLRRVKPIQVVAHFEALLTRATSNRP